MPPKKSAAGRSKSPAPGKRSKSPAPASASSKSDAPVRTNIGMTALYKPLFDRIDSNHSGSIDAKELWDAVSSSFGGITPLDLQSMMSEADVNHDGVISLEEFASIMTAAEGQSALWRSAQQSLWGTVKLNAADVVNVAHSAAKPLQEISRQHSYPRAFGRGGREEKTLQVASVGVRCFSSCCMGFLLLFFLIVVPYLIFWKACESRLDDNWRFRFLGAMNVITPEARAVECFKGWVTDDKKIFFDALYFLAYFASSGGGQNLLFWLFDLAIVDDNGEPFSFSRFAGWVMLDNLFFFPPQIFLSLALYFSPLLDKTSDNRPFELIGAIEAGSSLYQFWWWVINYGVLMCSGKSISQRLFGGEVVVIERKRSMKQGR